MNSKLRLDDLYKMIAHIYVEQNAHRPASATFAHFVEVCGMLTVHSRNKKREGATFVDAICKALGWYFPLMAKFKVTSIEEIIFRKYPYVCPYCRLKPHEDISCKTTRGTSKTVDHAALRSAYQANRELRPTTINEWQLMFQAVYPRSMDDARAGRSTLGLLEELGELAEAVRVFDRYPKYFAGEAADVFSYLMGMVNEYILSVQQEGDSLFSLEDELIKRYPGLCVQCGHGVCICPLVPEATVGRMAKELDIQDMDKLFRLDHEQFSRESIEVSTLVLNRVGGYSGLIDRFPFDRGDTNKALVLLCLRIADAISETDATTADSLRSAAIKIGAAATYAGSKRPQGQLEKLVASVRQTIEDIPPEVKSAAGASGQSLEENVGRMTIPKTKVLVVFANPRGTSALKLGQEDRAIRDAVQRGKARDSITLEIRHAATIDDLRRALLDDGYQVLHFSGHGNVDSLLFETEQGRKLASPLDAIAALIEHHSSIECVILNACDSLAAIIEPLADYTVGMGSTVDDAAAIEFSRGFYDAVAAGKSYEFAVEEGKLACQGKKLDLPVKMLRRVDFDDVRD
jgi:NTP pyrophosphatase (non-canonical NTP hydrolase)